jgi:F0F1-type ATP synthase assembly protein I
MLLDYATIVAMVCMFSSWSAFCSAASGIRGEFARVDAGELARAGASLFSSAAYAPTAARVQSTLYLWESVKTTASIALIFLTLRLFKYFQFQPRLAVMTESLFMAFTDGLHFLVLFGVLLGRDCEAELAARIADSVWAMQEARRASVAAADVPDSEAAPTPDEALGSKADAPTTHSRHPSTFESFWQGLFGLRP